MSLSSHSAYVSYLLSVKRCFGFSLIKGLKKISKIHIIEARQQKGKEEADMEVIRKFIDANSLMSIMALPEAFRNRKLEVIVLPTDEESAIQQKPDVAGIVQSLVGAIPHTDMTLSELRDERLGKYEAAN